MGTMMQASLMDRYRSSLTGKVTPLSPEEERALALAWRQGDDRAGRRLVEASLPFVIRVAREYRCWGVDLEDLVQQGNLGLLKAAKKFEPDKECRLITYAVYWIRAEIREYVVRSYRIVRLGSTRTERRAMRTFRRKEIEGPEQLAEESGMPVARAEKLWPLLVQGDSSLDAQHGERQPAIERVRDVEVSPDEWVDARQRDAGVRQVIQAAMAGLSERERMILRARLMSDQPQTLEQLGRQMGVSKERVRQLEERLRGRLKTQLAAYAPC